MGTASFPSNAEPGLDSAEGNKLQAWLFHMRCDSASVEGSWTVTTKCSGAIRFTCLCVDSGMNHCPIIYARLGQHMTANTSVESLPCTGEQDRSSSSSPQKASSLIIQGSGQDLPSRSISEPIDTYACFMLCPGLFLRSNAHVVAYTRDGVHIVNQ